jgi:hypothetical protein
MDNIDDLNCIQIIYNLDVIRIYYIQKNYYLSHTNMDCIKPCLYKTAQEVMQYLKKELLNRNNIDVRYFYNATTTKLKKKIKILEKNGYYNNVDIIYNLLLLLI